MGTIVIAEPAVEPVSLVEARLQVRIDVDGGSPDDHPEDPLLAIYIGAAREWAEDWTGKELASKTLELQLDAFSSEIEIPRGPVRSIISVKYIAEAEDGTQTEETVDPSNYVLDTSSDRIWLLAAEGFSWPDTADVVNAVKVRYEAGYDVAGESPPVYPLPKKAKLAMMLVIGHLYRNREEDVDKALTTIPMGARTFLQGIRIRQGMA